VGLTRRSAGLRGAKRQRDLEAADAALREGIEEAGEHAPAILFFERAVVLLRLGRDEEGVPLLLEYIRQAPEGELTARARSYAKRPDRARGEMIPDPHPSSWWTTRGGSCRARWAGAPRADPRSLPVR
jgi:hypothetical protein